VNGWVTARRRGVAWGIFGGTLLLLVATLDDPGITWDEPMYFASAQLQVEWAKLLVRKGPGAALDPDTIREMWDWNHYYNPHPPIYKTGMALTWSATRQWLGWIAAFRLSSAILFSALVALVFRWGTSAWSGVGGLAAAGSILLMPRLFGHAHLGATEAPLLVFWTLAAMGAWYAVERGERRGWPVAGVAWGLAVGTKFTGLAALAVPAVWGVWRDRAGALRGIVVAGLAAGVTFAALNPLVWADATGFFRTWFSESLHREEIVPIATYYLGQVWEFDVPWHHPFVMTAVVTPLGLLVMAVVGAFQGVFRRDGAATLALASVGFVWLVMLTPRAPHHDGVRQFVALFPFLAVLAGYGVHRVWAARGDRIALLACGFVFVPPAIQMGWIHPHHLAYYGEVVGGVRGAAERGFETTYWMDVVDEEVWSWMNGSLPRGAEVVVVGPVLPLERARAYGRLREDLVFRDELPGDVLLVLESQSLVTPAVRSAVRGVPPLYRKELAGVPLVSIYRLAPVESAAWKAGR